MCASSSQAHGARCERLTTSFRGVPNLQRAVNAAFAPLMTGDRETLQASYVPLAKSRDDLPGQPSLVALAGSRALRQAEHLRHGHRRLAARRGRRVRRLAGARERMAGDRATMARAADAGRQPRHVCLLFRRFVSFGTDITRAYVDALEARGINHLLVGGRAFHGREEIETLRAALAAVEWPDDQLSVFATLRGALFAIGDEELLEYRAPLREGVSSLPDTGGAAARTCSRSRTPFVCWRSCTSRRNRRPVADTISRSVRCDACARRLRAASRR